MHIKYLAKDPNVELLNKKCGGYQGYTIPRLSVCNGAEEDGQPAPTQQSATSDNGDRDLAVMVNSSIPLKLNARKRAKLKVKFKTT